VISKSDLIILVIASSALAVGIFRWHQNTQDVSAITIPASANSTVMVDSAQTRVQPEPGFKTTGESNATAVNTAIQTDADGQIVVQTQTKVIQPTQPVVEVVVGNTTNSAESIELGKHQVESGDYLGKIANQYGTDVQTLRELNNISGSVIQIGQEILYPR